jgi:hypothetical protein
MRLVHSLVPEAGMNAATRVVDRFQDVWTTLDQSRDGTAPAAANVGAPAPALMTATPRGVSRKRISLIGGGLPHPANTKAAIAHMQPSRVIGLPLPSRVYSEDAPSAALVPYICANPLVSLDIWS